jgi:hypothetical protein
MKFSYIGNQSNRDVRLAGGFANGAFITANSAASFANGAFVRANNSLNVSSGGTITGDISVTGNIIVTGANTSLGEISNVHIYGGNTGQVLITDEFGNLSFIDFPSIQSTVYTANTISLTNGVYVSGNVDSTKTLNDGDYYQITDGTNTGPAWIITTTFEGVSAFNRVVTNIDYTASSGHTIYFQVYNYDTTVWDNIGSYSGSSGYIQYALAVLNYSSYINTSSGGTVQVRLYHSNAGNAGHTTKLDYLALEFGTTGQQGPRGPTGPTGATGSGVNPGGTAGQILLKNSSTNYDTSWSNNLIDAWNTANAAFTAANTSSGTYAASAFDQANTAASFANSAFLTANSAYTAQNTTAGFANAAFLRANASYIAQNTTASFANGAFDKANSAGSFANGAFLVANSAASFANGAFDRSNGAYSQANSAGSFANGAFVTANSAASFANGAFAAANLKFNSSGGTISGDVNITGNLSVTGNTFSTSATQIVANDTLFIMGTGNYSGDVLDIGFAAHYNNGINAHTGLIRDSGTKEWQLFEEYTPEVGANNNIDINHASFKIATLNANLHSTTITIKNIDLLPYVNNAYDKANSGATFANASFLVANLAASFANGAFVTANSAASFANGAFGQANTAASFANAAFVTSNASYIAQNTTASFANGAFVTANSAASFANGAFVTANSSSSFANGAFDRANAAFNAANTGGSSTDSWARSQANAAFDAANSAVSASGSLTGYVDVFTGDGSTSSFSLSTSPNNENITFVAVQGVLQPKDSYSLSGSTLTFDSVIPNSAYIEVTTLSGGGGGGSSISWYIANANTTMVASRGYFVDTTVGPLTMTLPATATLGDTIRINDLAGTFSANNLTINRNSHKIEGATNDLLVNVDQTSFGLIYSNSTYGWKVIEL